MMNVEIAQRLAELRRERGFSQEGLAEQLGLSRQAVSKWERAESAPDMGNLIALADLYDVTLDELLRVSPEVEEDVRYEARERSRTAEAQAAEAAEVAREAAERAEAAAVAAVTAEGDGPQKVVVEVNAAPAAASSMGPAGCGAGVAPGAARPGAPGPPHAPAGQYYASHPSMPQAPVPPMPSMPQPPMAPMPPQVPQPPQPPQSKNPLRSFPYPLLCAVIFLLVGFCFGWWHPAWVIFLTIPFWYWIVGTLESDPAYRAWLAERERAAVSPVEVAAGAPVSADAPAPAERPASVDAPAPAPVGASAPAPASSEVGAPADSPSDEGGAR